MFKVGDRGVRQGMEGSILRVNGHAVVFHPDGETMWQTVREHEVQRPREERESPLTSLFPRDPNRPSWEDLEKVREIVRGFPLDWNGHYLEGTFWDRIPERYRFRGEGCTSGQDEAMAHLSPVLMTGYPSKHDIQRVLEAAAQGSVLDDFVTVCSSGSQYRCPYCGVEMEYETNGQHVRVKGACPNPKGLVTEWTMDFPSGKVLMANDLRELCRIASNRDINTRWGTHLQILDYARNGLVVGFGIGNSSPDAFSLGDDKYMVGKYLRGYWIIEKEDGADEWSESPPIGDESRPPDDYERAEPEGVTHLYHFCTDLWAYSLMDYDEAVRRVAYYGLPEDALTTHTKVVDVRPGRYLFRHFHEIPEDGALQVINGTFEWVGEAEPREDWCSKDTAFSVHFSQAAQIKSMRRWDRRHEQTWEDMFYAALVTEFNGCIPGRDWHRNGHRNDYLMDEVAEVPIREDFPRIRRMGGWWHPDTISNVVDDNPRWGKCTFNPSYARAAGRILESMISFGMQTHYRTDTQNPRTGSYNVDEVRAQMHQAVDWWRRLVALYPVVAEDMSDFADWMKDEAAVRLWIDSFDLGPRTRKDESESESLKRLRRDAAVSRMRHPGVQVRWLDGSDQGVTVEDPEPSAGTVMIQTETEVKRVQVSLLDITADERRKALNEALSLLG